MSKRASAVALATKGFRVFLLGLNSKTPIVDDFPARATSDPTKVESLWTDPFGGSRDENIGISTDDLLVLDFDVKAGRDVMEREFEAFNKVFKFKHVAVTWSGGYHVYFRLPNNTVCASTSKKLGKSIDTRSFHGYVVGPGSDIDGSLYTWLVSVPDDFDEPGSCADLALASADLIEACGAPAEKAVQHLNIEWDTPAALKQAKEYLINHAPLGKQGEGGDETAYKVACRVRDFGVSQDAALFTIDEFWNQKKAFPPWSLEELDKKLTNAYRYAKAVPHVPGSEFDPVDVGMPITENEADPIPADCPRFVAQTPFDPAVIPKREWIIEGVLAKGFVTLVNAPPGVGKTQWLAQLLLGMAFHNSDLAGYPIKESVNVWSFNAEDDINELKRRIGGAVIGYGLKWEDQASRFAISSGIDHDFRVAKWDANKQRVVKNEAALKAFARQIKENNVGAIIMDPLADLHEVPESNNDAIKEVVKIFTELAVRTNTAVAIATHSRKQPGTSSEGHAGNAESVRGGSSQVAKARIVLTLMPMSQKDAKAAKIDLSQQGSYMRIDSAKGNLGPTDRGAKPKWFKFEGVPLGNGDSIGVLKRAELADSRVKREGEAGSDDIHAGVLADILARMPRATAGVSWPKEVLTPFVKASGLAESTCKKWFVGLADIVTTEAGVIEKVRKAGAGGSVLRFYPKKDQPDTEDVLS